MGQDLNYKVLNTLILNDHKLPRLNNPQLIGDLNNDGIPEIITSGGDSDSLYVIYLDENFKISDHNLVDLRTVYDYDSMLLWENSFKVIDDFDNDGISEGIYQSFRVIGDLDNDGISEIAVGHPGINKGVVYILFLDSSGGLKSSELIAPFLEANPFYSEYPSADYFGEKVFPIGDINDDNIPDILILGFSEMFCDSLDTINKVLDINYQNLDTAYSIYLDCAEYNDSALPVIFLVKLNSDGSVKEYHPLIEYVDDYYLNQNDTSYFERPLWPIEVCNIGDVDGNGRVDLIIDGISALYVFFFNEDFSVKSIVPNFLHEDIMDEIQPVNAYKQSKIINISDVNMDGTHEFIIASNMSSNDDGEYINPWGYIGYMDISGEIKKLDTLNSNSIINMNYANLEYSQFGTSVSNLGDINGDGFIEIIVPNILSDTSELYGFSIISIYPDSCLDSECVWPGDANFDGIVNSKDIIQIGSVFSQTSDKKRTMATTEWVEQTCEDWNLNQFNVNAKHSDSDGNGVVNFLDASIVEKNYSKVSFKMDETVLTDPFGPPLYIISNRDTVSSQDSIVYSISLGDSTTRAENVYGVSMTLKHEVEEVFGSINSASFTGSWLGTKNVDMIATGFPLDDGIDIGMARTDQTNRTGQGYLSTVKVIIPDNLGEVFRDFDLRLTDLLIKSYEGDTIVPNVIYGDPVVILNKEELDVNLLEKGLKVYPNPNSGVFNIDSKLQLDKIRIMDLSGRAMKDFHRPSQHEVLNLSGFEKGVYLIEFQSGNLTAYERVFVK